MTAFDDATAITALGGGAHTAVCDPAWDAPRGPNGGYLAAIVLRAMAAELDDASRPARSITLHYLRPPHGGALRVDVVVERSGRTLSTLSARLTQDDRLCVMAIAAFAGAFPDAEGAQFSAPMPDVPPVTSTARPAGAGVWVMGRSSFRSRCVPCGCRRTVERGDVRPTLRVTRA